MKTEHELDFNAILKIDTTQDYQHRREHLQQTSVQANKDTKRVKSEILELDTTYSVNTDDSDCNFLLHWYRTYTNTYILPLKLFLNKHTNYTCSLEVLSDNIE